MTTLAIAWKNLKFRPLRALLSVLLFALSVGLISLLVNVRKQADQQFDRNLAGVDLVVGAKGSPLELVLNGMYQVGYPTGNVSLGQVRAFFNPRHPIVAAAVPLSSGDAYRGYRIVGTTPDILDWYGVDIGEGQIWQENFSVTIGAEVARETGLKIGDRFRSSHGIIDEGGEGIEHDDEFTVVGVLASSGTVLDQVILTTNQSYWYTHDEHEHAGGAAAGAAAENEGPSGRHRDQGHVHDHDHDHDHDHSPPTSTATNNKPTDASNGVEGHPKPGSIAALLSAEDDREITALLVRYRNKSSFQALSFPRNINENTELLAANPAYEISEVRRQFDGGQRILGLLVAIITLVSALSVFIALFTALRERRAELALLRTLGSGKGSLFLLLLSEALIIALLGYLLGIALSHGVLAILAGNTSEEFRYTLSATQFYAAEAWLLLGSLLLATVAGALPAWRAATVEVGSVLGEQGS